MGYLYGVPYVENTLYSTNKYSCVRPVHTLYISQNTTGMTNLMIIQNEDLVGK